MLERADIERKIAESLKGLSVRKVLLIPPDFTRLFSNAGLITNICYRYFVSRGAVVEILPALGTHEPMTESQMTEMFGDIPHACFSVHHWRTDVVRLGTVPGPFIGEITGGLWTDPVEVEINRKVMDPSFDLIVSIGQVVPHEVIGMANHSKNLFVGVGGADMINKSHMIGALYGLERMMGHADTPVRRIFDYGCEHFLHDVPILYMLTVCTAPGGKIRTHGLFIGPGRRPFEDAAALSQQKNIDFLDEPVRKFVVYLDPREFRSTWLGNKSIYRTRMAVADGGELLVLAPGVDKFGEDPGNDAVIRTYGYMGRLNVLEALKDREDLRNNLAVAAHLIHGSSDGRFNVTYAVRNISKKEIRSVHFRAADYREAVKIYDPRTLKYGFNDVGGERIFYVPNPALGLWMSKEKFLAEE